MASVYCQLYGVASQFESRDRFEKAILYLLIKLRVDETLLFLILAHFNRSLILSRCVRMWRDVRWVRRNVKIISQVVDSLGFGCKRIQLGISCSRNSKGTTWPAI